MAAKSATKLNLSIIRSYGFPYEITKPDIDDVEMTITLPNKLELSCLTVCYNEPTECDELEGLNGYLRVTSKEQLDDLINKTFEQIVKGIGEKNPDFDVENWI